MNILPFNTYDIVSTIAAFVPPEEALNFAQVNNLCHQEITQLPNFQEAVDEAFDAALSNDVDNPQILVKIDKRIHLVSEKFFFENATLGELFDYYSGHNELRIAQFVSTRSPKNLKILRHLMIQQIRANDRISELPWYTRIPLQIFRNGHMNSRCTQAIESRMKKQYFSNEENYGASQVHYFASQDYSNINLLKDEYTSKNFISRTLSFLASSTEMSSSVIRSLFYPATIVQFGFYVQDAALTEISSLKGRAICLTNALFYAIISLLSIPCALIATALAIAYLPIIPIISVIYATVGAFKSSQLLSWGETFAGTALIQCLVLGRIVMYEILPLFPLHIITLFKAIGGAIVDPSIFITTGNGVSGTIPHLMMGL